MTGLVGMATLNGDGVIVAGVGAVGDFIERDALDDLAVDADDEMAAAFFDGILDDLTYPESCGEERVPFRSRYQCDSGGTGHFNDGVFCFFYDSIAAEYRCA